MALSPRRGAYSILWKTAWDLLHDISIAVLLCVFLVTFVAQPFRVQGTSMLPLLEDSERILVNKLVYRFVSIARGDVVVFYYPKDPSVSFIKRVAGVPGDLIEIRNGTLLVNGSQVEESYLPANFRDRESYPPHRVREGYYFVLGDHRNGSNDSRTWGEVPEKYICGKAVLRFWPLTKGGLIR